MTQRSKRSKIANPIKRKRVFVDAVGTARCEAVVILRDKSTASCGRRWTVEKNGEKLCTQHAKKVERIAKEVKENITRYCPTCKRTTKHVKATLTCTKCGNISERLKLGATMKEIPLKEADRIVETPEDLSPPAPPVTDETPKRLTLAYARKQLGTRRMAIRSVDGEFQVKHRGTQWNGDGTYFTNDLHDAVATGVLMSARDGGD